MIKLGAYTPQASVIAETGLPWPLSSDVQLNEVRNYLRAEHEATGVSPETHLSMEVTWADGSRDTVEYWKDTTGREYIYPPVIHRTFKAWQKHVKKIREGHNIRPGQKPPQHRSTATEEGGEDV